MISIVFLLINRFLKKCSNFEKNYTLLVNIKYENVPVSEPSDRLDPGLKFTIWATDYLFEPENRRNIR